ncbi:MAG: hypothetical protein ACOY3Y_10850, partial [Acidobacteriota bacterium]
MRASLLFLPLLFAACGDDLPSACPRGKPVREARAVDGTTVEVRFACRLDGGSASDRDHFRLGNFAVEPPATLAVLGASAESNLVRLATEEQTALVGYTLQLSGVKDADGNELTGSANFLGAGKGGTAEVTLLVDDRYNASLKKVVLIVSVDPLTGLYSHLDRRIALADPDGDHRFETKLRVAVDPARTVDTADDRLGARYMAYTVRAVDEQDRPLSSLTPFEVTSEEAKTVAVPLLTVPKPPPPEGLVTVTFKVDDRPARALAAPSLRASTDAEGRFDAGFPTTVALADKDGDGIWEGTAKVRIDPDRVLGGSTATTKPYSAYLVEGETPYSARSADFAVPDEKAVEVSILIGAKDKVPVTFRVDVAAAWLEPDGSQKGVYP